MDSTELANLVAFMSRRSEHMSATAVADLDSEIYATYAHEIEDDDMTIDEFFDRPFEPDDLEFYGLA
jgi:hypothetical protein